MDASQRRLKNINLCRYGISIMLHLLVLLFGFVLLLIVITLI